MLNATVFNTEESWVEKSTMRKHLLLTLSCLTLDIKQHSLASITDSLPCNCTQVGYVSSPRWLTLFLLVVSVCHLILTCHRKQKVVTVLYMDENNSTETSRETWCTDVRLQHCRPVVTYKVCEQKYLQDERKKYKPCVNVQHKDLLCYCIFPANWKSTI